LIVMRALLLSALVAVPLAAQSTPEPAVQIAGAVSAAPEQYRAGATVLGYDKAGKLVTLRQGTNEMICLADKPEDTRWAVACYHKDLEPFMRRGRELRATGISRGQEDSVKLAEIRAGTLRMPDGPRTLYNLAAPADSVDQATGLARGASGLPVVYIPYATAESTGLPAKPGNGLPWIMFPGQPWAHIMIMR
jgi:hypothetical protein